ncbi:hypothetical protein Taro_000744 [Colocasia esculenta]|uniref:Uncharacterized protein n=1 Tax=Colocasia esculenta TaxID=4460 RepID=A0A843TE19_COLES|nr:hypothetical protein [Colocasia esculenta]
MEIPPPPDRTEVGSLSSDGMHGPPEEMGLWEINVACAGLTASWTPKPQWWALLGVSAEGVIGDKILSEGFEVNTPGKTNSSNARSYNRVEPSEGMNFENANDALTFYNTYGRNVGLYSSRGYNLATCAAHAPGVAWATYVEYPAHRPSNAVDAFPTGDASDAADASPTGDASDAADSDAADASLAGDDSPTGDASDVIDVSPTAMAVGVQFHSGGLSGVHSC